MKQKRKTLLLLLALLLALAIGVTAYRALSGTYSPETSVPTEQGGEAAADFTVTDMDGNKVSLSDLKGTPVVVNFWASWCQPCRSELADFDEAAAAYGDRGRFMMVNLTDGQQETAESVAAFMKENGYTFPVYLDTEMDGAAAYGVSSIPRTIFIDGEGNVAADQTGTISGQRLRETVDAMLE